MGWGRGKEVVMADGSASQDTSSGPIDEAIEVVVGGQCFIRSLVYPYIPERVGALWVMRDAARRSGRTRNESWVAHGASPDEIERTVQAHRRGGYTVAVICDAGAPQDAVRAGFRALGYRLGTTQALMARCLADAILPCDAPATIERVQTTEQAVRMAREWKLRQLPPEYFLPSSPLRQYIAIVSDTLVGCARSIAAAGGAYCSDVFVKPEFRRRGIASAMLTRMLTDDRAGGARTSVLLSTHTGAKLYPVVGYEHLGTLLLYYPKDV
jgi:GNAT superfamily N-acetyltransferase